MITIVEKMNTESPVHTKGRFVADFCLDRMLLLSGQTLNNINMFF